MIPFKFKPRNKIKCSHSAKILIAVAIMFILTIANTFGQKTIALNGELEKNSKALKVKSKGGTGMLSYTFGEYTTIDSKNKKSKQNEYQNVSLEEYIVSGLSKDDQKIWKSVERKQNFVFVGHAVDSTIVNMGFSYDSFSNVPDESRKDISDESSIAKNTREKFIAFVIPISISDKILWTLEMDTYTGKYVKAEGKIKSEGTLSDGYRKIEIIPIRKWSNGKKSANYPILGFEFVRDNKRLASVQSSRNIMHKKIVWLRNDLPKDLKITLATASSCLMSMVDEQAQKN